MTQVLLRNVRNEPALTVELNKNKGTVVLFTNTGPMNAEEFLHELDREVAKELSALINQAFAEDEWGWIA